MTIPPLNPQLLQMPGPAAPGQSAGMAASGTVPAPALQTEAQAPGLNALQMALTVARQTAVSMQNGLAPLMANAVSASATGSLPPNVQSAVQQLLSLHLPTDTMPTAASIKTALAQSGLFTEAALANGQIPQDLKTALAQLSREAQRWQAKIPSQNQPGLIPPNTAPPTRTGRPTAQGPAPASLPSNADPGIIAAMLSDGAEAALARQSLLQMASLPEPEEPSQTRWMFDVPLMTPHGAAVAQMVVERDARNASGEKAEPVWRAGLAIDIEPLGPVRANLAFSGGHAWVTITADRPDALQKLQKDSTWLTDALSLVTNEADVAFQQGGNKPITPNPYTGKSVMDRSP